MQLELGHVSRLRQKLKNINFKNLVYRRTHLQVPEFQNHLKCVLKIVQLNRAQYNVVQQPQWKSTFTHVCHNDNEHPHYLFVLTSPAYKLYFIGSDDHVLTPTVIIQIGDAKAVHPLDLKNGCYNLLNRKCPYIAGEKLTYFLEVPFYNLATEVC